MRRFIQVFRKIMHSKHVKYYTGFIPFIILKTNLKLIQVEANMKEISFFFLLFLVRPSSFT